MLGMIRWVLPKRKQRSIHMCEVHCLQMRFLCAELARSDRTPEGILRYRVNAAARKLRNAGVERVVLPVDFPWTELLEKRGVCPVSTKPLRRLLAADWVRAELESCHLSIGGAKIGVCAAELTGEVVRTVTELALRHRYVLLEVPYGGEELCRRLRREYGVSLLVAPTQEQLRQTERLLLFDPKKIDHPGTLRLYDEAQLPDISLASTLETQLPADLNRGQLLTALYSAGILQRGQMTVSLPA